MSVIPNCKKCNSEDVGFENWGISRGDEDTNIVFVCYACNTRFRDEYQKIE